MFGAANAQTAPRTDAILHRIMDEQEAAIIRAVLDGHTERFAELVDRYQQPALRLAYSLLGNAQDAQDASQEAFVSAYRALGGFNGRSRFSTWFYRIVVNKCRDWERQRARRPRAAAASGSTDGDGEGECLFDIADDAGDARQSAFNRQLGGALSDAIAALPMKQRTAFVLHHLNGLTLDEVAGMMHCRTGTVKSHVFRATEALRVAMHPWRGEAQ